LLLAFLVGAVASWAKARADEPSWDDKKAALMQGGFAFDPRTVKTERIIPVARPEDKNELDEQADLSADKPRKFVYRASVKTDTCTRHGMRKVSIRGGKSWRCK
jgi:hypothetical protein